MVDHAVTYKWYYKKKIVLNIPVHFTSQMTKYILKVQQHCVLAPGLVFFFFLISKWLNTILSLPSLVSKHAIYKVEKYSAILIFKKETLKKHSNKTPIINLLFLYYLLFQIQNL